MVKWLKKAMSTVKRNLARFVGVLADVLHMSREIFPLCLKRRMADMTFFNNLTLNHLTINFCQPKRFGDADAAVGGLHGAALQSRVVLK